MWDMTDLNPYEKKVLDAVRAALDRSQLLYYRVPSSVTFSPYTWDRHKERPSALWGIPVVVKMGQDPRVGAFHWDHFSLIDHPARYEFEIGLPELQLSRPSPSDYYAFPRLAHLSSEHHKVVDVRRLRALHDALSFAAREIEALGK